MGLLEQIRECQRCRLFSSSKQKVIAGGSASPEIIVIGEAPGEAEEQSGKPFVGPSGMRLREKLKPLGRRVLYLNVCKCRPPNNRTPSLPEVKECLAWLKIQLSIAFRINPKCRIILAGRTAAKALSSTPMAPNGLHKTDFGTAYVILHPAAPLHNPSLESQWESEWDAIYHWIGFKCAESDYCHFHTHSEFSYLDSILRVDDLPKFAKQKGFKSIALSDHYNMSAERRFLKACKDHGIKAFPGIEAYGDVGLATKGEGHLLVVALNQIGYENLKKLIAHAQSDSSKLRGGKVTTILPFPLIRDYKEGLLIGTACISGYFSEHPEDVLKWGPELGQNFYLEVMPAEVHNKTTRMWGDLRSKGFKLLTTCDSHYLNKEDYDIHRTLLGIRFHKSFNQSYGIDNEFWLKTEDEILEGQPDDIRLLLAEGIETSKRVSSEYPGVEYRSSEMLLPPPVQSRKDKMESDLSSRIFTDEYLERAESEWALIEKKGFVSYFCLIDDILHWCWSQGIWATCRGSVGGSLVAYLLGWHDADPIKYNILFARFLDESREDLPDVDIDVEAEQRQRVIDEYLVPRFGADSVAVACLMVTKFKDKLAKNDVCRCHDLDFRLRDAWDKGELTDIPKIVLEAEQRLNGQIKTKSQHPGAIVVASCPIGHVSPIEYRVPKDEDGKEEGRKRLLFCATPYTDLEQLGLVKFDLLRQDSLSILHECQTRIPNLTLPKRDFDDPVVWDAFCRVECSGIFQMESDGMRQLCHDVQPRSLTELAAVISLHRPGPLGTGLIPTYVTGKGFSGLEPYCADTRNTLIYQEQVMDVLHRAGKFPLSQCNTVRKVIAKKGNHEKIKAMKEQFIANGGSEEIWKIIVEYGGYGFNKAHGTTYAIRAYQMMWLKCYHPLEFTIAFLRHTKNRILPFIVEMRQRGMSIEDPDVNFSEPHFAIANNRVYGGLKLIKGIGPVSAEKIASGRPYKRYSDLVPYASKPQRMALAKAGALRSLFTSVRKAIAIVEGDGGASLTAFDDKPDDVRKWRKEVLTFPIPTEKPPELADFDSRFVKIKDLYTVNGFARIYATIMAAEKDSGRWSITFEDGTGVAEASSWAKEDFTEHIGSQIILNTANTQRGLQIIGIDDVDAWLMGQDDTVYVPGTTSESNIVGCVVAISTFITRRTKEEMANILVENKDGGGIITVFANQWVGIKTTLKVGGVFDAPVRKQGPGEYTANWR